MHTSNSLAQLLGTKIQQFTGITPTIVDGTITANGLVFVVETVTYNKSTRHTDFLLTHNGKSIDAYAMYGLIKRSK